jgi:hypothetical protein
MGAHLYACAPIVREPLIIAAHYYGSHLVWEPLSMVALVFAVEMAVIGKYRRLLKITY